MLCQSCSTSPQFATGLSHRLLFPSLLLLPSLPSLLLFSVALRQQDQGQSASLQSHHHHKLAFSCSLGLNIRHASEGASQTTSHPLHRCLWIPLPPSPNGGASC